MTVNAGDNAFSVARSLLGSLFGDTVHIDVDSLSQLDPTIGAGHKLSLTFDGDDQRAFQDLVTLDGTTGAVGYSLSVTSNSQINSSGTANITGDLSITSEQTGITGFGASLTHEGLLANANTGITLTGAHLTASGNLTLSAHSNLNVSTNGADSGDTTNAGHTTGTSVDGVLGISLITSFDSAAIDIGSGSVLTATSGDLKVNALVDGSLSGSATANSINLDIAVLIGKADPHVSIHGATTQLSAGGEIDVDAKSDLTTSMVTSPTSSSASNSSNFGAAVVVTAFESKATLDVSDSAQVSATGAAKLSASSKLDATSTADGTLGTNGGASVAISVIFGDTSASVDNATVGGSSVDVTAGSDRTITTTAKSTPDGANANGGTSQGEKTLTSNKASTTGGSQDINVAGAIAVGTDTGTTQAFVDTATVNAGSGAATVSASATDVVKIVADGSKTLDTSSTTNGVGVAVAVNVADRSNLAYVTGSSSVTASSLAIQVLAPKQSSFDVEATAGVGKASNIDAAGAFAVNTVFTTQKAYLGQNATLTLSGTTDVTIEAHADVKNIVKAKASDGNGDASKVGLGASVAFNYSEDETTAYIGDSASFSGDPHNLTLTADSKHEMETDATGGGKGSTAITPVVAISVANDGASALLGSGSLLTVGNNFSASSSLSNSVATSAEGDTKSGKTGVGISIALSIVNDDSTATTGRDLLASTGTAAFVSSVVSGSQSSAKASAAGGEQDGDEGTNDKVNDKKSNTETAADNLAKSKKNSAKGTQGASAPSASTSDGPVSVAGALAVNVELASSKAYIGDSRDVNVHGTLTVSSTANVDGRASAEGSAVIGGVEFDPTSAVDTTNDTIDLGSEHGLKDGDAVEYKHGEGGADIGGLTDGTTYYVHHDTGGKFKLFDTKDHATGSGYDGTTGLVDLTSKGSGTQHVLKGAGPGGTGVGAAIAINYAQDTNLAYIGTSTIHAGGLSLGATTAARDMTFDPSSKVNATDNTIDVGDSGLRNGDAVVYHHGNAGSDTGGLTDGTTYYVNVQSDGKLKLYDTRAHALAGGSTGLKDLTGGGSGTAHQLVDQTDSFGAQATSGAGGGKTGVAGSLAINVAITDSEAKLGYTDDVHTVHAPTVT
ncbi:MAG TPA: hypothetical protein VFK22_05355, partial [Candidatus Dormibacteraeota bacterium]|nr:hypothetical protein [Candidatus Dormibacteraeota bacterium]